MNKDHSIWTKLDRFPPIIVRLLGVMQGITDQEIERLTGLGLENVKRLSWCPTWAGVTVSQVRYFSEANGVRFEDPACMRRWTRYLKNDPKVAALKKDPLYGEYLERLRDLSEYSRGEN